MQNKSVFISHAREDFQTADKLYEYLQERGYKPWMDKKSLLPGQQWDLEIKKALRKADFIVLLLSKTSVAKRGYVQKEFRMALEYCEEKLDTDIFIIPCKLDDCEIPDKFAKFHSADMRDDKAFDLVFDALEEQYKKQKLSTLGPLGYDMITENYTIDHGRVINVEISYPKFLDEGNTDLKLFNALTYSSILESINEVIASEGDGLFWLHLLNYDIENYYLIVDDIAMELLHPNVLSINRYSHWYLGGAHGSYVTQGINYRLNPLAKFGIEALFDHNKKLLPTLQSLCIEKVFDLEDKDEEAGYEDEHRQKEFDRKNPDDVNLLKRRLPEKWDTFSNFYIKPHGIVLIFNVYVLSSYAYGEREVEIAFDEILSKHDELISFKQLRDILKS